MESVNISESARRLGISRKTVHRRIDAGELEAVDTPDGKQVLLRTEMTGTTYPTSPSTRTPRTCARTV